MGYYTKMEMALSQLAAEVENSKKIIQAYAKHADASQRNIQQSTERICRLESIYHTLEEEQQMLGIVYHLAPAIHALMHKDSEIGLISITLRVRLNKENIGFIPENTI